MFAMCLKHKSHHISFLIKTLNCTLSPVGYNSRSVAWDDNVIKKFIDETHSSPNTLGEK